MSPVCFAYIYVNIKPLQSFETQWYCEERRFGCLSILPLMQIQVPLDLKMSAYLKSKMLPDRCFIFLFLWSQKVCGIYYWNCVIREFCLALWLPTVLGAQVHYNPVSCSFWCQLKGPFILLSSSINIGTTLAFSPCHATPFQMISSQSIMTGSTKVSTLKLWILDAIYSISCWDTGPSWDFMRKQLDTKWCKYSHNNDLGLKVLLWEQRVNTVELD